MFGKGEIRDKGHRGLCIVNGSTRPISKTSQGWIQDEGSEFLLLPLTLKTKGNAGGNLVLLSSVGEAPDGPPNIPRLSCSPACSLSDQQRARTTNGKRGLVVKTEWEKSF